MRLSKNQNRTRRAIALCSTGLAAWVVAATSVANADTQLIVSETEATFTWAPAPGIPDSYEVFVSRSSNENSYQMEEVVAATNPPLVTLMASVGEILRVRVRAKRGEEVGPFSDPSDTVRLGLPVEVPKIGSPGTFFGRVGGADTEDIFSLDDNGQVWHYPAGDLTNPIALGSPVDATWELVISGDFDRDLDPDLFWRNTATDETRIWLLEGAAITVESTPASPGPNWSVLTSGDFDNLDGDDLFWRESSGQTEAWMGMLVDFDATPFPSVNPARWELLIAGDYDGNGHDDLFWRNMATTETVIWFMQVDGNGDAYGVYRYSENRELEWEIFESWDFNGDGTDDVHWRKVDSEDENDWWRMDGAEVLPDPSS